MDSYCIVETEVKMEMPVACNNQTASLHRDPDEPCGDWRAEDSVSAFLRGDFLIALVALGKSRRGLGLGLGIFSRNEETLCQFLRPPQRPIPCRGTDSPLVYLYPSRTLLQPALSSDSLPSLFHKNLYRHTTKGSLAIAYDIGRIR